MSHTNTTRSERKFEQSGQKIKEQIEEKRERETIRKKNKRRSSTNSEERRG